jgi:hypothetical protein
MFQDDDIQFGKILKMPLILQEGRDKLRPYRLLIILFLLGVLTVHAQDRVRRNFAWTLESGNDPILQVKNESDKNLTIEVRLMIDDASYRYPVDLLTPSGESRFLRVRELLQRLSERHFELKTATTGSLQIEFDGDSGSVQTSMINLNPKSGLTAEKDSTGVPRILSIQPSNGNPEGGTVVKVIGENFSDATSIRFGGIPALHDLQAEGILIAITPRHSPGTVDVEVANGKNHTRVLSGFRYEHESPTILKVEPDTGPSIGGIRASIRGHNFQAGTQVLWDEHPVMASFLSPDELGITVPAGQRGSVDVAVVNPDGAKFVLQDAFHYAGAPRILSVQPRMGIPAGGYTVTISGENFEPGCSALFGSRYGLTTFINPSTLAAIVPQGESGTVDVTVSTEHGETDTLESGFLYNDPPVIYSVVADPNPIVRNTTTTITVEANDPEAGILQFDYRVARGSGTISGQGKTAVYNSPNTVETAVIQVTVYDEHGAKAQENVEIRVE